MIDKVLWVGNGAGGGKVVAKAKELGYPTAYANLSINDMRALDNVDESEQLLIRGDGAGKDRDYAKKMLDMNLAIRFFHDQLRNREIKIVMIVFSTGGGSGSGISPMLIEALKYEFLDIVFVALPILPDLSESYVSQANTIEVIQELSELDVAVFPIDNQQVANFPNLPRHKVHDFINTQVVNTFHRLFNYTQIDSNNQFDETDLLKVLSEAGNGIIAEIDVAAIGSPVNLTHDGIIKVVHGSWEKSIFAPIEYEFAISAAVILDGQESLLDHVRTDEFFTKFQISPLYLFNGMYHEQNGRIMTVLTGLPWCKKRIKLIEDLIEKNKAKYEAVVASGANKYEVSSNVRELMNKIAPTQQQEKKQSKSSGKPSWRDLVDKYKKPNQQ